MATDIRGERGLAEHPRGFQAVWLSSGREDTLCDTVAKAYRWDTESEPSGKLGTGGEVMCQGGSPSEASVEFYCRC